MVKRISIKGNVISGQVVRYQVCADRDISDAEVKALEEMTESELLSYAQQNNLRCNRIN